MKYRTDFVTNSSSSSFVLSFKDKSDYLDFKSECEEFNYKDLFQLVDNLERISKKEASEIVYNYYSHIEKDKLFDKYIDKNLSFTERLKRQKELENEDWFKEKLNLELIKTNVFREIKKINKSEILIYGNVYDFEGGLLEFALRNDLLLDPMFHKWCRLAFNVG